MKVSSVGSIGIKGITERCPLKLGAPMGHSRFYCLLRAGYPPAPTVFTAILSAKV